MHLQSISSPLGQIIIQANEQGVTSVEFSDKKAVDNPSVETEQAAKQLEEYFSGERTSFELPLAPEGTEFQKQVWTTLQEIPQGKTWSYLDLAIAVGSEKHTRAVGLANGKNPIAIIIPCHRVIGSDGSLTGYAGGMDRKEWLLRHEGVITQQKLF